ncbi:hypothetical protein LDC_3098 [sediment metagenome]|uniref:DUF2007 domain-containing protein n=1 Tax=sediment metagenome TaxID=749907 RepID=D9PNG5_9ZZZZ
MWIEVKKAKTLAIAEMWKECFEGEGVPARIMPVSGLPIGQELADYSIMVPRDKEHVIKDILRKL